MPPLTADAFLDALDEPALVVGAGRTLGANAAARALLAHSQLSAGEIVRAGLEIAGDLCIYTNRNIEVVSVE